MDNPEQKPHRSIQDIIPPARSRPIRPQMREESSAMTPPPPTPPQPMDLRPDRPKGAARVVMIAAIVVIVIAAILGVITTAFHRAYITVTPDRYSANVDTTLESSVDSPTLPYRGMAAEDTVTKTVPATGSKHVENRASGTITVYNAFSEKSQRLITNTRFQTADGLVFRVHNAITVPGYTMKAGVKVPGTLEVTVYADEAGDKYNIGPSEFTLPGLTEAKQHELIYARSTGSLAGGFIGEQATVDSQVRADTVTALKADLERSLREKIRATVAEGYIVFPDTVKISYSELTDTADGPSKDLREARNAAENIVPTTTGASIAAGEAFPAIKGIFGGLSVRVPTSVVSLSDFVIITKKPVTVDAVNDVFRAAAKEPFYQGILDVTDEELVSSDFIGNSHSAIVDLNLTKVIGDNMLKVVAWYDNEWGYSNRLIEVVSDVGRILHSK
jgi:hypothetical protein